MKGEPQMLWYRSFSAAREPMSSYTHFLGALLSLIGFPLSVLLYFLKGSGEPLHLLAALIFCCSTLALYTTSCVYHFSCGTPAHINHLRKLDHAMIYVLIAGSYTPVCLTVLRNDGGLTLFATIWGLALAGVVLTIAKLDIPRWLTSVIYLVMGWLAVFAIVPLSRLMPGAGMFWLILGGVLYTVGGVLYAVKWPGRNNPRFGCHEIFHVFILLGSIAHFLMIYRVILPY